MLPSESKWIHIYTETHYTKTPLGCYRGMSLAFSSVVMDTSRHIRHPISRRMLSASEGLAPSEPPLLHRGKDILYPLPPKFNPQPLFSQKAASGSKTSLLVTNGGLNANSSYLRVLPPGLLLTDGLNYNK